MSAHQPFDFLQRKHPDMRRKIRSFAPCLPRSGGIIRAQKSGASEISPPRRKISILLKKIKKA